MLLASLIRSLFRIRPAAPTRSKAALAEAVREARLLAERGEFDAALTTLDSFRDVGRLDPDYRALLGLLSHRFGRADESEAHYQAALDAKPGDAAILYEYGVLLAYRERLGEAGRALMRAWLQRPRDPACIVALMSVMHKLSGAPGEEVARCGDPAPDYVGLIAAGNRARFAGEFEVAEAYFRSARQIHAEAPFAYRQLGCLLAIQGRLEEADQAFRHCAAFGLIPDSAVRLDPAFLDALGPRQATSEHGATTAQQASIASTRHAAFASVGRLVFSSCDTVYFQTFAHAFVASILQNAGGEWAFHFHLICPEGTAMTLIEQLRERTGYALIFWSEEPPQARDEQSASTYFACSRFLRLPEILRRYRCPVLTADVDMIALRDFAPIERAFEDADCAAIRSHALRKDPWECILAGVVLARPSAAAIRFLERVSAYIRFFLEAGQAVWFLDQIALFAVDALDRMRGEPVLGTLPASWVEFEDLSADEAETRKDALLWSITYSRTEMRSRTEHPLYLKYAG